MFNLICSIFVLFSLKEVVFSLEQQGADKSPYWQWLPDCESQIQKDMAIVKKTNSKALLCPLFKDEEGFLSEWTAYYQMHGFDHIMFYDDGSSDNSAVELKPWLDSGFVTIRYNFTVESLGFSQPRKTNIFNNAMNKKMLMEFECKQWAIENNYTYFVSLDMDEYVIPRIPKTTIVDAMEKFLVNTGKLP
jgi:hypothetical protein